MSEKEISSEELKKLQIFQKEFKLNTFSTAADIVLDNASQLNKKDITYLTKNLIKGRDMFLKAVDKKNKTAQQTIMQDIPNAEKQWDNILNFRKGVALASLDTKYGITEAFKVSSQGQDVAAILSGDNQPVINSEGTYGFNMTNAMTGNKTWMSLRNISGLVKSETFDTASKKIIYAMAQDILEKSKLEDAGDFNREEVRRKVKSSIVDRGNIRSLTDDKMLDDSFRNNLITVAKGMSYKNVGINKEGNLDDDDAKQIVSTMLLDKEAHMNYLVDYYTDFMAQNWKPKNKKDKKGKVKGKVFEKTGGGKLWKA